MSLNSHDSQLSLSEVWVMLNSIPAEDRESWLRVGMARKSEYGDAALSLYNDWSSSAHNYRESSVNEVWRSFKGQGSANGTLVHLASQHGFGSTTTQGKQTKKAAPQPSATSRYAKEIWLASDRDDHLVASHPYAIKKGIDGAGGCARGRASSNLPSGIGINADCLVVPIRNIETNKIQGVQCINEHGIKQTFGKVTGGALLLGNTLKKDSPWYVCEGWASAYSTVFHHRKNVAVCSFGKGNQEKTAHAIAEAYRPGEIIILEEVPK
jgi:putative DNA primase/helicase